MKWHYTSLNDYPKPRKGKGEDDEFQCLVYDRGQYRLLYWNCHYECWDDEQGDDYYCDKEQVQEWCPLDEIIERLDSIDYGEEEK